MGDKQDDPYAVRRTELERQFRALPPAGTAEYWRRIEGPDAPPLEVLARCLRERMGATALPDAHRIFSVIMRHCQASVRYWAGHVASSARAGMQPQLREELQQECFLKLWKDLAADGPTFLLEQFMHTLGRLQQHVAHDLMHKEGEWQRKGVERPDRVPRDQIDSVMKNTDGDEETSLVEHVPHPGAADDFDKAELSDLFALIDQLPPDDRKIVYDRFMLDLPQEATAADLDITTRTVRNRLRTILRELGIRYRGGKEGNRG